MSQIFLVINSLHPLKKFCHWALTIAIHVSIAICQLPIRQFWQDLYVNDNDGHDLEMLPLTFCTHSVFDNVIVFKFSTHVSKVV